MSSRALVSWTTTRADRLDQLHAAHSSVAGPGPGRKYGTQQLNWSLNLKLAAEFQGFARELHDIVGDELVQGVTNGTLASIMRKHFTENRQLDKGNAQYNSIDGDFSRFGITLWDALDKRYQRTASWQKSLKFLNEGRNAIAHSNDSRIKIIKNDGYDVSSMEAFRACRSKMNGLASAMDRVMADYVATVLNSPRPW